mgnify:CR=1 FL=1
MKFDQNNLPPKIYDAVAAVFLWSLAGLSFLVYPLALFPPAIKIGETALFNLTHTISLPGAVLLSLLAIPVLLFFPWCVPRFLFWAMIAFAGMHLVNIPLEMECLTASFILFGYLSIPLASAVLRAHGRFDFKHIARWATALWGLQILLGTISIFRGMEPSGTPGNINWMAGLVLMLSPWVMIFFIHIHFYKRFLNFTTSMMLTQPLVLQVLKMCQDMGL